MNKYPAIHEAALQLKGATHDYKEEWHADRYFVGDKMFAMRGGNKEGRDILTVKVEPSQGEILRTENPAIISGYHMNKSHWVSVLLDEEKNEEFLAKLLAHGYEQVLRKLPKYRQREIESM
ncbi:MmcQ/YjbR family DNA-binding protein [Listeria booriae]|uniref:MmcQ/YjbR family DNA-binding protein n=1 Tax=Listeria booriae TaxID=1552123 RepID=UPI001E3406F2|nr:MmcQ/YjbR family DNA-binding protein [Listeria booriae]MCD2205662.1 MmcQ/YjbR family DNA-binding protein [Listeria booriae]